MIDTKMAISEWLDATVDAAKETAETMLGYETVTTIEMSDGWPDKLSGSYIPLVSEEYKLQIGLISDSMGCSELAEKLLGMEPPSKEDIADSVGEIMNMIAGGVKNRVNDRATSLKIGFPIYVVGSIHVSDNMEKAIAEVRFDNTKAKIVILQLRNSGKGA